jgi:transketolase
MKNEIVQKLRREIVLAAYNAGEGHIASAFSILDILWVLYSRVLRKEDQFVLSKGHGCLALYAILAERGTIPKESLSTFCKKNSILGGHPDHNKIPGVEASTGSLGHGLPIAVGKALAWKIQGKLGRVFCLVGDGECNEGSIWEACLLAAHHKLDNLCVIVDHNHSTDRALGLGRLDMKFSSFDFYTMPVAGHNHDDIETVLSYQRFLTPTAIIAETIKGRGCERMESNPAWHHKVPNEVEFQEILTELS